MHAFSTGVHPKLLHVQVRSMSNFHLLFSRGAENDEHEIAGRENGGQNSRT